jgi:hypothetical protein
MASKLGVLSKIDIRQAWQNEEHDFTPWLAQPDNLARLGDEIGIGMEAVQTEVKIGKYELDILAKEENSDRKIIIENQLEASDHSHLGQLLTYASGVGAQYVIWIVRDAHEEHIKAVDWLNEHTDEDVSFFLVQVELWKIGDSEPAPKFSVVCRPNDWAKTIGGSSGGGTLPEVKAMQLDFWQQLKDYGEEKGVDFKFRKPRAQHWYDFSIGRADCHLAFVADTKDQSVKCEFYIPDDKHLYEWLASHKTEIEKDLAIQDKLEWQPLPEKKAARIRTRRSFDFDAEEWIKAIEWLVSTGIAFKKTFRKYADKSES